MQKLFDALVDLAGSAANEEFPVPAVPVLSPVEFVQTEEPGWNAFDIWHRRIRPGVKSLFQTQS